MGRDEASGCLHRCVDKCTVAQTDPSCVYRFTFNVWQLERLAFDD